MLDANGQAPLALVRIDFDDDGTWDEAIDYGHRNFYATFRHTYTATGTVTARAEVIDADDRSTVRTIALTVIDPGPSVDITYRVDGAASDFAACWASGPPASCDDCTIPLGVSSGSGTIGTVLRGGSVSVSQTFVQSEARYESGCLFALTLLVEANGVPLAQLGRAECSTSNRLNVMSCAATVSAVVP